MPLSRIDPDRYSALFAAKAERLRRDFAALDPPEPQRFASPPLGYRLRAEFRMWHADGRIDYAMFDPANPRRVLTIEDFPPAAQPIRTLMPMLRERLMADETLSRRLFQTEFLATLKGETLASLIYHRPLDADWEAAAQALAADLGIPLIGRSRGQKIVIGRDWLEEEIIVDGMRLRYRQIEGGFTQPNGAINRAMLGWARAQAANLGGGDLLELYCGNGNFTVALAPFFDKVLATESNKSSVAAARHNLEANGVRNVALARLASDEVGAALAGTRPFRRLADIDLGAFRFSTLFVDPPRAGLDTATRALARGFDNILYLSCNPATLRANVAMLPEHRLAAAAVFDQFPYTDHLECGLLLQKRRARPPSPPLAPAPQ
ncbi:MAG: tRNA (uridine(54)-C5)-methyltransferase TrmA [Azoarcus sp.]|jgi:tRNA (uracil-5-)-methyltransferase|nr:tRNA (uridine(54)-C5)-methyltransferase TrmA [Azoarcus sp.]